MSESTSSVVSLLSRVAAEVGAVKKGDRNQQQKFSFRGIDAVTKAVYPALVRHGVIAVPDLQSVEYETQQARSGGNLNLCRVIVGYVFWGPAGDTVRAVVAAEAMDSGDKATAKAMSVAFRTALLQVLTLPTDEPDPDSFTYETQAPARAVAAAPAPSVENVLAEIESATTTKELQGVYVSNQLGSPGVPVRVREAFDARLAVVQAEGVQA